MQVHTLDKLNLSAPAGKRLVVLGDPIAHSLSPAMHNAALQTMVGEFLELAGWRYEAVHVPAAELAKALPILHAAGVAGINLTIPHKVRVLEIIEDVEKTARCMGAVNTLIRTPTGYRGTNTDGFGILKAIEESFHRSLADGDIWLYGAGGAARGIVVACLEAGARRITILNRTTDRLRELEADLRAQALPGLDRVRFCTLEEAPRDMDPDAILINATSLGLKSADPSPIDSSCLRPGMVVYDTTYGAVSQLARDCGQARVAYADGLSMLVWQGVKSLEIWTGRPVPAARMREAALDELRKRTQNG
ncbi:MAG TPA: shikimate dehydrogenase [Oceanipulchritudo sp.]|nr:shikimate dehydrogenase [Oceanipulchritudo sp.]